MGVVRRPLYKRADGPIDVTSVVSERGNPFAAFDDMERDDFWGIVMEVKWRFRDQPAPDNDCTFL
jgi:hypothetical protein